MRHELDATALAASAAVRRGHAAEVTAVRITPWLDERELPLLLSAGVATVPQTRLWSPRETPRVGAAARRRGRAFGDGARRPRLGASTDSARAATAACARGTRPTARCAGRSSSCRPSATSACAPSPALVAAGAPVGGGSGGAAATAATLALPSADANEVVLWDVRARAPARTLAPSTALGKAGMCMCVRFADDGRLLAGWEDGSLQLFDLRGGGGGGSGGGGAAARRASSTRSRCCRSTSTRRARRR